MGLEYLLLPDEHFVVDPNKVERLKSSTGLSQKKTDCNYNTPHTSPS